MSERTNPDYVDEKISRMVREYLACPSGWGEAYLAGLDAEDREELLERLDQP